VGIYTCVVLCLCEGRTSVCSGQILFSFLWTNFVIFFNQRIGIFLDFFFFFGSLNMIISLSCWKDSPNFYIKTIGAKKNTPLVCRGLVNHPISTRGVFLMKYEFSKHPFDVSLITLEMFLLVSLGGGWSWQAELIN
jgi:hypothetical protein